MVWSMCKALVTKFGAVWGAVNAARARHKLSGLLLKTAAPELAALVRHSGLRGRLGRGFESAAVQQTGDEKQGDHGNTEAQKGQGELRQQRNGALAGVAQITANADVAVKLHIHERAAVEAVSGQRAAWPGTADSGPADSDRGRKSLRSTVGWNPRKGVGFA